MKNTRLEFTSLSAFKFKKIKASTIVLNWIIDRQLSITRIILQLFITLAWNNEEIIRLTLDALEIFTRHDANRNVFWSRDVFHHWGQQQSVNLPLVLIMRPQCNACLSSRLDWTRATPCSSSAILTHVEPFPYKSETLQIIEKNYHTANIQREVYIAINAFSRDWFRNDLNTNIR